MVLVEEILFGDFPFRSSQRLSFVSLGLLASCVASWTTGNHNRHGQLCCARRRGPWTALKTTEATLDCPFVENGLVFIIPKIGGARAPLAPPPCDPPALDGGMWHTAEEVEEGVNEWYGRRFKSDHPTLSPFFELFGVLPNLELFFSHFSALVRVSYCTFDSNNDISYHSNTPHNSPIYDEWLADL